MPNFPLTPCEHVMTDELPPDPDLDDLPRARAEHDGMLSIRARDPDTGETFTAPTTHQDVARGLADLRRQRENEDDQ
jgi:hypothetical protein